MLFHGALVSFLAVIISTSVFALESDQPSHLDRRKVPKGCATCHYGFNFKSGGGPNVCIICHGEPSRRTQEYKYMPKGFAPKGVDLRNIEAEFSKTYRHPTFDAGGRHEGKEVLPEIDSRTPRHAVCVDCHNPHYVSPGKKFAGIKGKGTGNLQSQISSEHELCYKCHGDSANLPGRSTNKQVEFSRNNPSFHPVEAEGKNAAVVSLLKPYKEKKINPGDVSMVACGDCHGSDNPSAPRGPHGSKYEYILADNYSIKDDQPESVFNYALCYRCHSRTSILGDESFKFHSLHINGRGGITAGAKNGTSCFTCHTAHGSTENKYLIRFNKDVVLPNARGMLKFAEKGVSSFRGECYLSCHGVDHDPKKY
jgi:predicted CXXCH cytochrome family protein